MPWLSADSRRACLRRIAEALVRLSRMRSPVGASTIPAARSPTTCPACHGDHICPTQRRAAGGAQQWILVRCGDCESVSEHLISDAQAAVLDAELERQVALIHRDLARIDAARMADQIETFASALRRDLLRPEDFGGRTR